MTRLVVGVVFWLSCTFLPIEQVNAAYSREIYYKWLRISLCANAVQACFWNAVNDGDPSFFKVSAATAIGFSLSFVPSTFLRPPGGVSVDSARTRGAVAGLASIVIGLGCVKALSLLVGHP